MEALIVPITRYKFVLGYLREGLLIANILVANKLVACQRMLFKITCLQSSPGGHKFKRFPREKGGNVGRRE